jgi:hypothetical protein
LRVVTLMAIPIRKLPSLKIFVGDFWNRKFAELVI